MSEPERIFEDEPRKTVLRRWRCNVDGCQGEMRGTGHGFTQLETNWEHKCNTCGRTEWTTGNYPMILHLPQK